MKTANKTEKDKPKVLKSIKNLANKGKPQVEPTTKKAKLSARPPADENIDSNVCCACFWEL